MTMRIATRRALLYPAAVAAASDWWSWLDAAYDVVGAYDFRSASSLADATKIGTTPTVEEAPGGVPVLTAAGLECTADTILDTAITAVSGCSLAVSFANVPETSETKTAFGAYHQTGPKRLYLAPSNAAGTGVLFAYGGFLEVLSFATAGTMAVANQDCYIDGSWVDQTVLGAFGVPAAGPSLYIGAMSVSGAAPQNIFSGDIASVVFTSDAISAVDIAELHTRMNA